MKIELTDAELLPIQQGIEWGEWTADATDAVADLVAAKVAEAFTDAADDVKGVREHGLPRGVSAHPSHPYIEKWLRDRAALLSPPTADTEESDRG